ncbi:hypothetical protein ACLEDV_09130 [Lonsdalea quercina]|uniref:hypothetical protein n=1 Tax=Lonsdalea quercina TaxID=71657 RepID=UPI0039749C79
MEFLIVALFGILILLVVFFGYFFLGGLYFGTSLSNAELGAFGSYFGGLAGPLLTFISVLLIVYTIRQQKLNLESVSDENIKQDMLRYLNKIDDEIAHLLTRRIHIDNERVVEVGDVVSGISKPTNFDESSYRVAMDKLLRLTANYCEAIALYRENVNGYFIFRAHQQRAKELVKYLENNTKYLHGIAGPTLNFCQMHLDGKKDNT